LDRGSHLGLRAEDVDAVLVLASTARRRPAVATVAKWLIVMVALREAGCTESFDPDERLMAAIDQRMAAAIKMLQRQATKGRGSKR
jgi:hypothetical protein